MHVAQNYVVRSTYLNTFMALDLPLPFSRCSKLLRKCYLNLFQLMEAMNEKLYEHPNFVWLDQLAVKEILEKRKPNNCEPVTILNNLLRWTLYQVRMGETRIFFFLRIIKTS